MTDNGNEQLEPIHELWLRARRVLAPWGIRVDREHLDLWRDQARHGHGPLRSAERGQVEAVEELITLPRLLSGIEDPQAARSDAHASED